MHERETLIGCFLRVLEPETKRNLGMCPPWESIGDLWLCRMTPSQLSHTGQGEILDLG